MTSAHYLPSYEGRRAKKTDLFLGHPGLNSPSAAPLPHTDTPTYTGI